LAQNNIEVNLKDVDSCSLLSYATQNGHLEVTKLLLAQYDIEVNLKDCHSHSPLSYATENGNLDMMKLLLSQDNIDVNSKDNWGQLPLAYAGGHSAEIVQLFMVQTTMGLSSSNEIVASLVRMHSLYPQSNGIQYSLTQ
jgi:ankyrin repeat protein